MTNHEHYFGTPEATSRMEVRFLCHPIRVEVWATEPMTTVTTHRPVTTHRQIIKDFTGVRDYLSWLESEYDAVASPAHYTSGGIEAKDALMGRDGRKRAVPDGLLQVELCVQVLAEVRVQERRRGPAQVQAMHRISD